MDKKDFNTFRLMEEVARDGSPSQRELSRRLNLSLGLVNTFIKRLVSKGYLKIKNLPRNRVKYLLTPKGVARKSKLTVDYLRSSVNFYRVVKKLLLSKFKEMEGNQINSILFFGSGEVADLAYLYLQLTDIQLAGIVDDRQNKDDFFEFKVEDFDRLNQKDWDAILLTRLDDKDRDMKCLIEKGVNPDRIATL